MKIPVASFIFSALTLIFVTSNLNGQVIFPIEGFPIGGTVGTTLTFNLDLGCYGLNHPNATVSWDFGSEATPARPITNCNFDAATLSGGCSQNVIYSTPGEKIVTYTVDASAGSLPVMTKINIFDCSMPSIPHGAVVIGSDTTISQGSSQVFWVNRGVTVSVNSGANTFFAEPGSTISGAANSVLYMKGGSASKSVRGENSIIFGDGATINSNSSDFTLNCSGLEFDYSNAPPNAAHPSSSVKSDLTTVPITLSPNPTTGMLSVHGLPSENITASIYTILGTLVLEQRDLPAQDVTLDLSKLVPGTYYIRFSSPNSVVTRKVIKE